MTYPDERRERIVAEAAEWHARLDSPEMDWEAFGVWLDADPAHRAAYDDVAILDAEIDERREAIGAMLPANDDVVSQTLPGRTSRRWWTGGGLALTAALAVLLLPITSIFNSAAPVIYRTGPTEIRTVALKDGSRIVVDRNSELALNDGAAPRIDMKAGSAWFDIRHDPDRAMVIAAGDYEVRDIGTRFDVVRSNGHLSVAVADGRVSVGPRGGAATTVEAGHRLDIAERDDQAVMRAADARTMGSWRGDRLVYDNTPLSLVALDLTRYVGRPVTVDPAIADLRLSGVLTIGDGSRLVGQIEALLPIRAKVEANRIYLARGRRH